MAAAAAAASGPTVSEITSPRLSSKAAQNESKTWGEWFRDGFNRPIEWLNQKTPTTSSDDFIRTFRIDAKEPWYATVGKVAFAVLSLGLIPLIFFAADWGCEGLSKLRSLFSKKDDGANSETQRLDTHDAQSTTNLTSV